MGYKYLQILTDFMTLRAYTHQGFALSTFTENERIVLVRQTVTYQQKLVKGWSFQCGQVHICFYIKY